MPPTVANALTALEDARQGLERHTRRLRVWTSITIAVCAFNGLTGAWNLGILAYRWLHH
jgi:hypothetical protein